MLRKRGCSRLLAPVLPMLQPNGGQLPGSALPSRSSANIRNHRSPHLPPHRSRSRRDVEALLRGRASQAAFGPRCDGADTLAGGLGADILTGGNQADTFLFTSASDSNNQSGVDVIKDFKHAQGDIIDLSGIDADTITAGDQAFTFTDAFHGVAGELYVSQIGKTLFYVQGDTNGDSNVDFVLQVTSPTALVAADFIL